MAERDKNQKGADTGVVGLLRGVTDLITRLQEVADTGEPVTKTGSFDFGPKVGGGKPGKGIFGLTVNVGLPGEQPRVEPFGNLRQDVDTGESLVEETREPLVDVFDEEARFLVIAELPGVDAEDIHVQLADHTLTLSAEHGEHKYEKRIEVPEGLRPEGVTVACRNGIAEINYPKR